MKNKGKDGIIYEKSKVLQRLLLQRKVIKKNKHFDMFEKSLALINRKSMHFGLAPLNLIVQISLNIGCNANCIMCDRRKYDSSTRFNYDSVLGLIDLLDNETVMAVKLIGGEPLLDKDGLLNAIKKCREKNIRVVFVTNGYFLDEKYIDLIVDNGLSGITISLDGVGKRHDQIRGIPGLFNKVEKALIYIKTKHPGLKITVNNVIMKDSINMALELANWANSIGVDSLYFCRVENFKKNYRELAITDYDYQALSKRLSIFGGNIGIFMRQKHCLEVKDMAQCDYLLQRLNINDQGKIIPCQVDGNQFYLDRPIKELYKNDIFRKYILDKINNCNIHK